MKTKEKDIRQKIIRKEIGYKAPKIPKLRCGNCVHRYCDNPGAYIPGYACKLLDRAAKRKKFTITHNKWTYTGIDVVGVCDNHKLKK